MPTSTIYEINKAGVKGYDSSGHKFGIFHGQIKGVEPTAMGCAIILDDGTRIKMMMGHNRLETMLLASRMIAGQDKKQA